MKKFSLFAVIIAFAMAARAQFMVNPSLENTINKGDIFDVFVLDGASVDKLQAAGKTVHQYFANPYEERSFMWWNGWTDGDVSFPGVDNHAAGYISLSVTGAGGWSGGGFNQGGNGMDLSHVTDDTRLHVALRTPGKAPVSLALIFFDGEKDCGSVPVKLSFGKKTFKGNGVAFPLVGNFSADGSWVALDIRFSDLKKLYPSFDFKAIGNWTGNYLAILSGAAAGTSFSVDAFYLYTPKNPSAVRE